MRTPPALPRWAFGAAVCAGVPAALLAGRILRCGRVTFTFLAFNLALAATPVAFAVWAAHEDRHGRTASTVVALGLWLVFFPNAPYLLSDFVHLRQRSGIPLWYDLAMLAAFAAAGTALGIASLARVHGVVARRLGAWGGWAFVVASCGFAGLGVYLGRFLRWNSWDLLLSPKAVLSDVLARAAHPGAHPQMWGVAVVFGGLLLAVYVAIVASRGGARFATPEARSSTIPP